MKIIVAGNISEDIYCHLERLGFAVYRSPFCDRVLPPLGYHPDMQAVLLVSTLVCDAELAEEYEKILSGSEINILKGSSSVQSNYPKDVAYNIKVVGNRVFHNFRYTDSVLTNLMADKLKINVCRGYSGCSICKVGDNALITADRVIYEKACSCAVEAVIISPGHILLPGFDSGFIGGASFCFGNTVYFFGNINDHCDSKKILDFCNSHGYDVVCLGNGPLTDYGSAITFE